MFIDVLFGFVWNWLKGLFKSDECYKTDQGYNCHHRVYADGTKECGSRNGQFLNICAVPVWYMDTERYARPMDTPPDNSRSD